MKKAMISIVIPIYNTEKYLVDCVTSVQKQSYHNLEIILVDDGSTDASGMICDKLASGDERIKVIHKKNGGNNSARKAGIRIARGQYVGFVDSDDWIDSEMYERLISEAEKSNSEVTMFQQMFKEDMDGTRVVKYGADEGVYASRVEKERLLENLFYYKSYDVSGVNVNLFNVLFSRILLQHYFECIPDYIQISEDALLTYACVINAQSINLLAEAHYHYRMRSDSITHLVDRAALLNTAYLYDEFYKMFKAHEDSELLIKQLDIWIVQVLFIRVNIMGLTQGQSISKYMFPWIAVNPGDRIILYGAGRVGKSYYMQLMNSKRIEFVAWVDTDAESYIHRGFTVEPVENLVNYDFDKIIVAVKRRDIANEIQENLIDMGVLKEKIYWEVPESLLEYCLPYDKYL